MNFLGTLFATFVFFAFNAQAVKWGNVILKKESPYRPLALVRQRGSTSLKLATPYKYQKSTVLAEYPYITENENGPTEELLTACSASINNKRNAIEKEWRDDDKLDQSGLFFLQQYIGEFMLCMSGAKPRVEKAQRNAESTEEKYCGPSEAERYGIGFSVSADDDGKDIQFLPVYEICYSKIIAAEKPHQGTLYTVHRFVSPSLMLLKLIEDYKTSPLDSYTSFLEGDLRKVKRFYQNHYAYKFVGKYDMPTRAMQYTTRFPFNFTPVPQQPDLYKGMISIDNYLRLFSLMNNQSLVLYSGVYEKPASPGRSFIVKSLWRIIRDDDFNAILIVTQYSDKEMKNCGETYICPDEGREMLKEYINGGCSYMCPVSNEIIQQLGSPVFNIGGILPLTIKFPKQKSSSKQDKGDEGESQDTESETVTAKINDFLGEESFSVVLMKFDTELATMITDDTEIEGYDGEG